MDQYLNLAHVNYIRDLIGPEHIGIGGDYNGVTMSPDGLENVSKYPNLFATLLEQNWKESDLGKLASGNLIRVWKEVEAVRDNLSDEKPKLIENKKNKSNNFIFIFNFLLFVILLCSIGFSAYIWINFKNNNNEELLLELKASIFDEIKENSRKNNLELSIQINNLYSKKISSA